MTTRPFPAEHGAGPQRIDTFTESGMSSVTLPANAADINAGDKYIDTEENRP